MSNQDTKNLLENKRAELNNRLAAVKRDLQQNHSQDFAEQTTERENDDVLHSIATETEADLALVNSALQRIASGEYGLCKTCGAAIAAQRLAILPEAVTCIGCAV